MGLRIKQWKTKTNTPSLWKARPLSKTFPFDEGEKNDMRAPKNAANINRGHKNSNPSNNNAIDSRKNNTYNQNDRKLRSVYWQIRPVTKRSTALKNAILLPMQQTNRLPGKEDQQDRVRINNRTHKTLKLKKSMLRSKIWNRKCQIFTAALHSEVRRPPKL